MLPAEAQLCPFTTLPTRGCRKPFEQQRGHFSCLYFGCRSTRAAGSCGLGDTFHVPDGLQPRSLVLPSDVPHSRVCAELSLVVPSVGARLERRSLLPAPGPYPSRQDCCLHTSPSPELTWKGREEPRGNPGVGSGPAAAQGAGGAVPWKRRGAGKRPGGSRWRRRTLAAPRAAPAAPGWPRAPSASGSPAACGVGSGVTAGTVPFHTHAAFGQGGCKRGRLHFASSTFWTNSDCIH